MSTEDLHPNIPCPLNLIMVSSPEKLAQSNVLNSLLSKMGRHCAIKKNQNGRGEKEKKMLDP